MVKSVLITGCNRGIGLEFVRHFLNAKPPPDHVIGTCRDQSKSEDLNALAERYPNRLHIVKFDVTHWNEYDGIVKIVNEIVGVGNGLNLLINNAAILPESEELDVINPECMIETYKVNCVAPIILSKHFLPLLKIASISNEHEAMGIHRAAIVNISSDWGSITERETSECGSYYPYRCSKSALNMGMKNLSIDLTEDKIFVTAIHPGWVKTDMGGSNGALSVEESVCMMMKTLSNMAKENHGSFVQFDGAVLPW